MYRNIFKTTKIHVQLIYNLHARINLNKNTKRTTTKKFLVKYCSIVYALFQQDLKQDFMQ